MRADSLSRGIAEGVGEEHLGVIAIRFKNELICMRVLLPVFGKANLHARLQQRSERLRKHHRQATFSQTA
ncbi:MAG: hypothetical protein BWZ07_02625 [Alphaproteobacteria bacterium ADurb.BinA280]|nr:MAG: hypothetical protein BWZ07_02625 [Alphaproteobacteria bacterium ADurb.BinA280]